jgi:DNA-binding GntR family transcriptional regulator
MLDISSPFVASLEAPAAEGAITVATRRLRSALITCEIAPGAFVNEAALAETFGLGRAGIRVALTALAASGFVSRHARQGWRIAPIDGRLVEGVLEARRRLEPSLADRRLGRSELDALGPLLGLVDSVAGRTDRTALATARSAERQIRDILAAGTGSLCRGWLADLWDHSDRIVKALDRADHHVAPADWRLVVAALSRGDDAQEAAAAIGREIERFETVVARSVLAAADTLQPPPARSARRRTPRGTSRRAEVMSLSKEQQR